jgi:predicted TIM-barrel fold metal-dependent hydrolase
MILDCELYLLDFPVAGRSYDIPALESLLDEAGIDRAVLMPPVTVKPDNSWMVEQIRGNSRFIPCALLNPHFGDEAVKELELGVREWGIQGLKLMSTKHGFHIASKLAHPLMAKCAELGIPASIHSEGGYAHPLAIAALARAFPDVPVIMDHMGYRYWVADAIEAARQAPNIYLATTAVMEPHFIHMAINAVGVERVVFGSNGPLAIPKIQLDVIKFLQLSPEDEAKILGGTLAKLYKVKLD